MHEHKKIILTKNVGSLSLVNVHKFLFPLDHIILNTQLVTNLISQILAILGRPFFATSKAIIQCRSGQLELTFGNFMVTLSMFHDGNYQPEVNNFGSLRLLNYCVSYSNILYTDHWEEHLEHFDIDFYNDTSIRKVKALLDFILLIDVINEIVNTKPLPDDEWTHDVPKEPPIFNIKSWPP